MNQYFEVGEEVVLVSKSLPELNGDHVISHEVIRGGDGVYECPVTSEFFSATSPASSANKVCYYLHGLKDGSKPRLWCQSALRKKHPKGESFDTLMEKLNEGVTA